MVSQRVVEQLQNLDYRIIQWSVDSLDWHQDTNVDQILINTIPDIKDNAIILFHSAGSVGQDLSATHWLRRLFSRNSSMKFELIMKVT